MLTLQAKNKKNIYSNDKVVTLPQLDFAVTKREVILLEFLVKITKRTIA